METPRSLEFDLTYFKQLIGAGLDGIESARREIDGRVFTSPSRPEVWKPAVVGTIGILFSPRIPPLHALRQNVQMLLIRHVGQQS